MVRSPYREKTWIGLRAVDSLNPSSVWFLLRLASKYGHQYQVEMALSSRLKILLLLLPHSRCCARLEKLLRWWEEEEEAAAFTCSDFRRAWPTWCPELYLFHFFLSLFLFSFSLVSLGSFLNEAMSLCVWPPTNSQAHLLHSSGHGAICIALQPLSLAPRNDGSYSHKTTNGGAQSGHFLQWKCRHAQNWRNLLIRFVFFFTKKVQEVY